MTDLYAEGGWTMYPTTLFGILAVLSAVVLAVRPERRFVPLFVSLSGLTFMFGFLGTMWGLTGMVKAHSNAAPADLEAIMTACATQALNSLLLASVLVVFGMLFVVSGALRVAIARTATSAA